MLIKVYGSRSSRLKVMIREAIEYAGNKLLSKRIRDGMEITVKMKDDLQENVAEVEWLDDNVRPRVFELCLDKNQSEMLQMICIMHEMVHIRQYATGDLVQSMKNGKQNKWMKSEWIDDTKVGYYDLPWEIEAHGREKGMLLEWMKQTDLLTEREKEEWRRKFLF